MVRQWTSQKSLNDNHETLQKISDLVLGLITNADEVEGISNHEIASELNVPTATISGITRPLVLSGLVRELKKRKCKITGNTVIVWTTRPKKEVKVDYF
jgi:Mn-dependent DtxR family transcriptional regulator